MTPREAAAKCREMAKQEVMGCAYAYRNAAALIDQINAPKPWPPPEDVRECHAFSIAHKKWIYVSGELCRCTGYTHWLSMPAAPEVKG